MKGTIEVFTYQFLSTEASAEQRMMRIDLHLAVFSTQQELVNTMQTIVTSNHFITERSLYGIAATWGDNPKEIYYFKSFPDNLLVILNDYLVDLQTLALRHIHKKYAHWDDICPRYKSAIYQTQLYRLYRGIRLEIDPHEVPAKPTLLSKLKALVSCRKLFRKPSRSSQTS